LEILHTGGVSDPSVSGAIRGIAGGVQKEDLSISRSERIKKFLVLVVLLAVAAAAIAAVSVGVGGATATWAVVGAVDRVISHIGGYGVAAAVVAATVTAVTCSVIALSLLWFPSQRKNYPSILDEDSCG
jgi:hypothetical protein